MQPEFRAWQKIARLNREVTVTEKIDGTSSIVHISEDGVVTAGSRNRWITPDDDNAGFAKWVRANEEELRKLGPGYHYGEFWGQGIQRRYGLDHKRFSLFNVARWGDDAVRPACCHVVPTITRGLLRDGIVEVAIELLRLKGSIAAPGFMNPEGVVVYHGASGQLFKVTCEKDESPKGVQS